MRRSSIAFLAGAVSTLVLTQIASAADMPVKAPLAPAIIPYSWTGFYVGANVGYAWGPWDASASQIIFDPSTTHDPKVDGWLGGLQAGYNWQSGRWVFGVEGDIQITGAKDSDNWSAPGAPPVTTPPPISSQATAALPVLPTGGNFPGLRRFVLVRAFYLQSVGCFM